jgi:hypothetical protein
VNAPILAQALLEHGMLDSAIAGAANLITDAGDLIQAKPWVLIIVAVIVALLIRPKR